MGKQLVAYYSRRGQNFEGGELRSLANLRKLCLAARVTEGLPSHGAQDGQSLVNRMESRNAEQVLVHAEETGQGSFCWSCGPASRSAARTSNSE